MASTLNAALSAVAALLFWTCLGAAIARRIVPGALALPIAPALGWAVHSALALPLFRIVGFSQMSVLVVAGLALVASLTALRMERRPDGADAGARVSGWAFAAAALLAIVVAVALLPKTVADGVILAGPIFDHSKIAMVDEMARLGVPPGNPFFGEAGPRLVYYYLLHFGAAELALAFGVSGWEADIAMTAVTAFASLTLMMGLAVRLGARGSAALWVIPLALAASLRPVLSLLWSADKLDAVLLPDTGFAGWLFQSSWVPQHLMSASCAVIAAVLMSRLADRGILRVVVLALVVVAGFESSTWVGGVTFAIAGLVVGMTLLILAAPGQRLSLLVRFAIAAMLTACVAAPFLHDQITVAAVRATGAPVVLAHHMVLGDFFSDGVRRLLDLPAYWLVLLPVELPAIYVTGMIALIMLIGRAGLDRDRRRDAWALASLAAGGLAVSWLLVSTLGDNNDLGWRAALPGILVLTVFAAVGLADWIAGRAWVAVAAALGAICIGLPRSIEIIRDNAAGHMQPDAKAFAQAPEVWEAVRRHSASDERVANNPTFLRGVTPWPANISWALLANRRSCYAGPEFTLIFTALPAARHDEIDAQFNRVFDGKGTADDVRDLATRYGCRVVVLTPADGAWRRDLFAESSFYRLVEIKPERWRIYRDASRGLTR